MREIFGTVLIGVVMLLTLASAQESSLPAQDTASSQKFVNSAWTEAETMLSKAISIRAKGLEEKTRVRFDKNWTPKASLEWSLGNGVDGFNAIYKPETQTMYFPIRVLYELTARHKQSSGSLNSDTAAGDAEFAELLDHELGHQLMDQVSRRNGLGPWFTEERFAGSTEGEQMGLDILSEGTALFFQRVNFPRDDRDLSEAVFPTIREEQKYLTYRMIAYDGGYWIVRDVLNKYEERGLIWLMRHPFVARDDIRAAAVSYRQLALKELSKQ